MLSRYEDRFRHLPSSRAPVYPKNIYVMRFLLVEYARRLT